METDDRRRIQPEKAVDLGFDKDVFLCWTCGSCDFECPVNIAAGRLRPRKIVRMAMLGLIEELLCLPEIWYCQQCLRCVQTCPNAVKPADVIDFIRKEAVSRQLISLDAFQRRRDRFARFQRVRWRAAAAALAGRTVELTEARWQRWMDTPPPPAPYQVISGNIMPAFLKYQKPMQETRILRCFACGECSSACPISCQRRVFDPRTLLRMVHLGQADALFRSPALWLCLECNRCTDACSQKVDGRGMIRFLRDAAVKSGAVDPAFFSRLEQSNRVIYPRFLKVIDELLGISALENDDCHGRAYA